MRVLKYNGSLLKYSLAISIFLLLVMLVMRVILAGSQHSDLGGVEQNVVYSIQTLISGGNIYTDPGQAPFSITQYTPVFHYICTVTARLCGLDPILDLHGIYVIGRYWNIFFNLTSAFICFRFARYVLDASFNISTILGIATFIFVFRQGFTVRPDSLMDMMLIFSVYLFARYLKNETPDKLHLSAALVISVAAIFCKQSAVQLPIILVSFLVFTCRWKDLSWSLLVVLISFSLMFGGLYFYYGPAFSQNVVGGIANGIDPEWFWFYIFGFGFRIKVLVPAVFILCIAFYRWRVFTAGVLERFLCFCALGMFVFASVTSLKSGSNVEYFYPFLIISFLTIVHFIYSLGDTHPYKTSFQYLLLYYILGVSAMNTFYQYIQIRDVEFHDRPKVEKKEKQAVDVANYIAAELRGRDHKYAFANLDDESLVDSVNGRRSINNILFKYCLIPQLDIYKSSNVRSNVLGYASFEQMLRSGSVLYMIESSPAFAFKIIPDLDEIKIKYFKLEKKMGPYLIYKYNPQISSE